MLVLRRAVLQVLMLIHEAVRDLVISVGCNVLEWPFTYTDVPLGGIHRLFLFD